MSKKSVKRQALFILFSLSCLAYAGPKKKSEQPQQKPQQEEKTQSANQKRRPKEADSQEQSGQSISKGKKRLVGGPVGQLKHIDSMQEEKIDPSMQEEKIEKIDHVQKESMEGLEKAGKQNAVHQLKNLTAQNFGNQLLEEFFAPILPKSVDKPQGQVQQSAQNVDDQILEEFFAPVLPKSVDKPQGQVQQADQNVDDQVIEEFFAPVLPKSVDKRQGQVEKMQQSAQNIDDQILEEFLAPVLPKSVDKREGQVENPNSRIDWILELECEASKEELRDFLSDPKKKIRKSSIPSKLLFDSHGQKNEIDLKIQNGFSWQKAFAELNVGTEFSWPQEQNMSPDLLIKIQNLIRDSVDLDQSSDMISLWRPSRERVIELLSNPGQTSFKQTSIGTKAQFFDDKTIERLNKELPDWKNAQISEVRWFEGERAALEKIIQAFDTQVNNFDISWSLRFSHSINERDIFKFFSDPAQKIQQRLIEPTLCFVLGGQNVEVSLQGEGPKWKKEISELAMNVEMSWVQEKESTLIKDINDLIKGSNDLSRFSSLNWEWGIGKKKIGKLASFGGYRKLDSISELCEGSNTRFLEQKLPAWKNARISKDVWFDEKNGILEKAIDIFDRYVRKAKIDYSKRGFGADREINFSTLWQLEFGCAITPKEIAELLANPNKKLQKELDATQLSFFLDGQIVAIDLRDPKVLSEEKEISELKAFLEVGWCHEKGMHGVIENINTLMKESVNLSGSRASYCSWNLRKRILAERLSSPGQKTCIIPVSKMVRYLGDVTVNRLNNELPDWESANLSKVFWIQEKKVALEKRLNILDHYVMQTRKNYLEKGFGVVDSGISFVTDWSLTFKCSITSKEIAELLTSPDKKHQKHLSASQLSFYCDGDMVENDLQSQKGPVWEKEVSELTASLEITFPHGKNMNPGLLEKLNALIKKSFDPANPDGARLSCEWKIGKKTLMEFFSNPELKSESNASIPEMVGVFDDETANLINKEIPDAANVHFLEVKWFQGQQSILEKVVKIFDNHVRQQCDSTKID